MNPVQIVTIVFSLALVLLVLGSWSGVLVLLGISIALGFFKRKLFRSLVGIGGAILSWMLMIGQQEASLYESNSVQSFSGLVVATTKRTAFVLQDASGQERYVTHKESVELGNQVTVKGYITAAKLFSGGFTNYLHFFDRFKTSPLAGVFDYPAWLAMKGYDGGIGAFAIKKIGYCVDCLPWRNRSVVRLIEEVERWRGDTEQAGLLLGLLVGHRGMLSKQTNEQFAESGLIHLIAVSGGNLVMIASLLGLLLFWLPVYVRFVVIGIGLGLYGLLCGFDSSVVRALIMAILGLVAIFLGRPTLSWRILTVTYLAMLCWNPLYLLYDLGFQLSFMAVSGILLFQERYGSLWDERIQDRKKHQKSLFRGVWSHILVSLGAFTFTLPILFLAMGKVNITGLLSNIMIVPFIPLLQIGGFVSTWTSEWLASDGVIRWMLDFLIQIAQWTQYYGVQIVIEELWVKWVMVGLWGVGVFIGLRRKSTALT